MLTGQQLFLNCFTE